MWSKAIISQLYRKISNFEKHNFNEILDDLFYNLQILTQVDIPIYIQLNITEKMVKKFDSAADASVTMKEFIHYFIGLSILYSKNEYEESIYTSDYQFEDSLLTYLEEPKQKYVQNIESELNNDANIALMSKKEQIQFPDKLRKARKFLNGLYTKYNCKLVINNNSDFIQTIDTLNSYIEKQDINNALKQITKLKKFFVNPVQFKDPSSDRNLYTNFLLIIDKIEQHIQQPLDFITNQTTKNSTIFQLLTELSQIASNMLLLSEFNSLIDDIDQIFETLDNSLNETKHKINLLKQIPSPASEQFQTDLQALIVYHRELEDDHTCLKGLFQEFSIAEPYDEFQKIELTRPQLSTQAEKVKRYIFLFRSILDSNNNEQMQKTLPIFLSLNSDERTKFITDKLAIAENNRAFPLYVIENVVYQDIINDFSLDIDCLKNIFTQQKTLLLKEILMIVNTIYEQETHPTNHVEQSIFREIDNHLRSVLDARSNLKPGEFPHYRLFTPAPLKSTVMKNDECHNESKIKLH